MDDKNRTNDKPCLINLKTERCSVKGTVRPEDCMRNSKSNRCVYSETYKKGTKKREDNPNNRLLLKKKCQNAFEHNEKINFKSSKMMQCLRFKELVETDSLQ